MQGRPQFFSQGGGRDFLVTKLVKELRTNLKKKDQNSRKKVQNSRKRNKTQEKRYKTNKAPGPGGGAFASLPPPLWPPLFRRCHFRNCFFLPFFLSFFTFFLEFCSFFLSFVPFFVSFDPFS